MSWRENTNDDDSDDEEQQDQDTGNDHVIFLIDARMGHTYVKMCLTVLLSVTKAKIIASNKSNVGVIFFGTKHKNTDVDGAPDNVFTLFSLDAPSASRIKEITYLMKHKEKFDSLIGMSEDTTVVNLKEALWLCCQHFNMKKSAHKDADFHRMWVFTADDNPYGGNPSERNKVITIAKDAADSGGEVSLWIVKTSSKHDFDLDIFYKSLLFLENDDELPFRVITSEAEGFNNLSYLRKKEYRKRSMATVPLILGEDVSLSVQIFKLLDATSKPYAKNLYKTTNELLKIVSRPIDCYGSRIDPTSIKTYVPIGSSRVYITKEEADLIKYGSRSSGSIRLLYCSSAANLSLDMNVGAPYFIYPCDASTKGSSVLFAALLNDMASKGLLAVAEFHRTKTSTGKLVALMPQIERVDNDGVLTDSPGFNMIPLPFAADIRKTPVSTSLAALESTSEDALRSAEALIKSFQLEDSFEYSLVENPSIQKFYAVLQAIALTEEEIEWNEGQDKLQPNSEALALYEDVFLSFKSSFGLEDVPTGEPKKRATKRDAGDQAATPAKKSKAIETDDGFDKAAVKSMVENGTISKCTVAELKEFCRSLGVAVGGTKGVLIERISGAL